MTDEIEQEGEGKGEKNCVAAMLLRGRMALAGRHYNYTIDYTSSML